MMKKRLRVILADDHTLFREALRSQLARETDIEVVGETERAGDLAQLIERTPCDVLLLDLQMERWSLNDIGELSTKVGIVVVTASERAADALAAVRLGARAVVQKHLALETLIDAIRAAAEGLVWLPPHLQAQLADDWRSPARSSLTNREREVTRLAALGLRNAEIAKRLFISELTVKTHLNNVFQKLSLRDRVELTRYAIREGLVGIHESET
jgi:DNA-binding NarL/FixJ family response regulator